MKTLVELEIRKSEGIRRILLQHHLVGEIHGCDGIWGYNVRFSGRQYWPFDSHKEASNTEIGFKTYRDAKTALVAHLRKHLLSEHVLVVNSSHKRRG